jgi:hypothetical protein
MKKLVFVFSKVGLRCLAGVAFITLCTFNVIVGLSDYETKKALADVSPCLEIHTAVSEKVRTSAIGYCYRHVNGVDTLEVSLHNCTSQNAGSRSICNKVTCKTGSGCFIQD